MKVSVITVCLNSAESIEDTIKSVLVQDYNNIEYIIVDGASKDKTLEILAKYRSRISACISEPDNGVYDAMNKGLGLATGEIVGFLNADDVYAGPGVISEIVATFGDDHTDAIYGDLVYIGQKDAGRVVRYWQAGQYQPGAFRDGWVPPHPTFFCRTALYHKLGVYDPAYQIAGDFELMLRFIEKHRIRVQYISKPFVRMRTGGRANTLRGIIQGNREIIHAFRNNRLAFPSSFFCLKLFRKLQQFVKRPSMNVVRREG